MHTVSYGFDPAPPGMFPATKALVDSDLDGIISGAILRNVYPEIEIFLGEATSMTEGKYDNLIDDKTIIVDLKYINGCGLYFDHHAGNKPDSNKFPGRWQDTGSAARVVYEYFKQVVDLSNFDPIMEGVDIFDSGGLTLEGFLSPNNIVKLGLSINRHDDEFNMYLIKELSKNKLDYVVSIGEVAKRLQEVMDKRVEIFQFIKSNYQIKSNIAFIDVSNYPGKEKITGYVLTSQFPEVEAVVTYKRDRERDRIKVRFYKNDFRKSPRNLNLLGLARKLNSKAGGHKGACGYLMDEKVTIKETNELVLKYIDEFEE